MYFIIINISYATNAINRFKTKTFLPELVRACNFINQNTVSWRFKLLIYSI
jgi:hypothetical protein